MRSNKASRLETTVQGSKGSPKSKRKKASKKKSSKRHAQMARLELERNQAVAKLKELEDLLDKLPDIFESKFSQRLAPLLGDKDCFLRKTHTCRLRSTLMPTRR